MHTETPSDILPVAEAGLVECRMHSVAVQTACFDASYDFYTRILGLRVVREPFKFKTRMLAWLDAGTVLIELFSVKGGVEPQAYNDRSVGVTHLAFEVADLDQVKDLLVKHGITPIKGPFLPQSGDPRQPRVLFVEDPDGAEIQFREPERLR